MMRNRLRGAALAAAAATLIAGGITAQGPARVRANPPTAEEHDNLSELHFAALGRAASTEEEQSEDSGVRPPRLSASVRIPARRVTPWNSEAGERQAGDALDLGARRGAMATLGLTLDRPSYLRAKLRSRGSGNLCCEPNLVLDDSKCCTYTIPEDDTGTSARYYQPLHVFGSESKSRDFAATVRASMPLFLPYKRKSVRPTQGWLYNKGSFHGAMDYSRNDTESGKDPTFGVYSVGPGLVKSVHWNHLSGNVVAVEHVAPNGDKYRSVYKHLRNGFDHDLEKARSRVIKEEDKYDDDGKPTRVYKYWLYAQKSNPNKLHWGTNDHKIAVKPGDRVSTGQFLGYAGNTGDGGAGNGLDDKGNPKNTTTANTHLHFMMAVPHPTQSADWVQVDPYGVYNKADTDCYELLEETRYVRLFAPFFPDFHNVPTAVLKKYFGYYTGMGYALQTLSVHRKGSKVLASGSFQRGLPGQWKARFYMEPDDFQHWFDTYHKMGLRPRELAVTRDSAGRPRFTAIWKKRGNERYYTFTSLSDSEFKAKWKQLVDGQKMRVDDLFGYEAGAGSDRFAALFVGDGDSAFYEWRGMTGDELNKKFADYYKQGWRLVSLNATEQDGKVRFAGVWRRVPGQWACRFGMTPSEYQEWYDRYAKQGFRLHKVQGYYDSDRFLAIWTKS